MKLNSWWWNETKNERADFKRKAVAIYLLRMYFHQNVVELLGVLQLRLGLLDANGVYQWTRLHSPVHRKLYVLVKCERSHEWVKAGVYITTCAPT